MDFIEISSERLAYWFLRLNGFLTTYNFVVHPEEADSSGQYPQQTDIDVIGIRFPYRKENRRRPMVDHQDFRSEDVIQLVLAETKSGQCSLNNSWCDSNRENMQKVLSATGVLPPLLVDEASAALYERGHWRNDFVWVRWAVFGESHNRTLGKNYPDLPQLKWKEQVLPFVYDRFQVYACEKRMHDQWDSDAKGLFRAAIQAGSSNDFIDRVKIMNPQG